MKSTLRLPANVFLECRSRLCIVGQNNGLTAAPALLRTVFLLLVSLPFSSRLVHPQVSGHPTPPPPPPGARSPKCANRPVPQLEDITAKSGIGFTHTSSQDKRYIFESMSGGAIIIDYDRDGWPDIYLTNAPTIDMAIKGQTSLGALYRNNHDGTFTDVTQKAGLTKACLAMGGAVGDYDNDGWPDLYIACLGGNILYHNNGDGTFTDVNRKQAIGTRVEALWRITSSYQVTHESNSPTR